MRLKGLNQEIELVELGRIIFGRPIKQKVSDFVSKDIPLGERTITFSVYTLDIEGLDTTHTVRWKGHTYEVVDMLIDDTYTQFSNIKLNSLGTGSEDFGLDLV